MPTHSTETPGWPPSTTPLENSLHHGNQVACHARNGLSLSIQVMTPHANRQQLLEPLQLSTTPSNTSTTLSSKPATLCSNHGATQHPTVSAGGTMSAPRHTPMPTTS